MKAVLIGDKKEFSDDFDKILTKTGTKRYFYSSYLHIMLFNVLNNACFGHIQKEDTRYFDGVSSYYICFRKCKQYRFGQIGCDDSGNNIYRK